MPQQQWDTILYIASEHESRRQTHLVQTTLKWLVETTTERPSEDRAGRLGLTVLVSSYKPVQMQTWCRHGNADKNLQVFGCD